MRHGLPVQKQKRNSRQHHVGNRSFPGRGHLAEMTACRASAARIAASSVMPCKRPMATKGAGAASSGGLAEAAALAIANSPMVRPSTSASRRAIRSKLLAGVTRRWRISAHSLGQNDEPGSNPSSGETAAHAVNVPVCAARARTRATR